MRLDHLSYAAGPEGLNETTNRLTELLGEKFTDGGIHPRFGTSNATLALAGGQYLEIVEVLDHPAAEKAPFGQAVRARSEAGGGWLGWVVRVKDLGPVEERLERKAVQGNRYRPDGVELRWLQIGVRGLQADPQLPFFVHWQGDPALHPGAAATGDIAIHRIEMGGDRSRVADWLGASPEESAPNIEIDWQPSARPGIRNVTFSSPAGPVRI